MMDKFKIIRMISVLLLAVSSFTGAQEVSVDQNELKNVDGKTVQFTNYTGPHDFVNTLSQIRSVGRSLGDSLPREESGEAFYGNKYRVLHIVNPQIETGLDSDVFIIEPTAAVDHIRNIRVMLAGYLEAAYGLNQKDSGTLAEFITYYNAVYRGDSAMVKSRYKPPVLEALNPEFIGIDEHYSNWPGKTQILIPLRGDSVLAVNTSTITDSKVIDAMREEEDQRIDTRRDMVDIREKELDEQQKKLDKRQEEIARTEKESPPKTEAKKKELEEKKAAVEKEQKKIEKQTDEVIQMREDIAEDQNAILDNEKEKKTIKIKAPEAAAAAAPETVKVEPVWFLRIDNIGEGIPYGQVVKYNLSDGAVLALSDTNAVRGRTIASINDDILVISGKEDDNSSVRATLLDKDTLKTKKTGSDEVFPGSLLLIEKGNIYLVVKDSNQWKLGKFNADLKRTALSELVIEPWTSISFEGSSIYAQAPRGQVVKLSSASLREERTLEE